MRRVPLSIIVFDVFELEENYLDLYFKALREWNSKGLEETQVLVVSQRLNAKAAHAVCSAQPFPVDLIHARQEFVAGYPVWDIMASIRLVWPLVSGRYVTFNHPEFIWGPDRLERTIGWLKSRFPYYAMGNLRRPGSQQDISRQRISDHCIKEVSEQFRVALSNGNQTYAKHLFETIPNSWWMFWDPNEQQPGTVPYIEDAFFADKDWLDSWHFAEHGGEMPFQDVYDLIGAAIRTVLLKHGISVPCVRMHQTINRLMHIWHAKQWLSWTPELRDWFLADPKRWEGTKFLDHQTWNILIRLRAEMPKTYGPVNELRHAPGGTVNRYAESLDGWLKRGGAFQVEDFYRQHGRQRRTA